MWDIEAHLRDVKAHTFSIPHERAWPAGEPIHDLSIRLTIDLEWRIHGVEVSMDSVPHAPCPNAAPPMQRLVGERIGSGWRQTIARHLGGDVGCTHLREVLFGMATAAIQALPNFPQPSDPETPPAHLGQCVGWAFDGPVVEKAYPLHFRPRRAP